MTDEEHQEVSKALLLAFAPLHRLAMGVAMGVVLGGLLFLVTMVQVIRGGFPEPNLWLLTNYFPGYGVTLSGAFAGLLWGFGIGFLMGWGFALVRNVVVWIWLTIIRSRAEMEQYSDFLDHL